MLRLVVYRLQALRDVRDVEQRKIDAPSCTLSCARSSSAALDMLLRYRQIPHDPHVSTWALGIRARACWRQGRPFSPLISRSLLYLLFHCYV
jgi:hypothetical protein